MAGQRGPNAGISGFVDLTGTPSFNVRIYTFSHQVGTGQIVRTKRGDKFKRIRQSTPGSTLVLSGKVRKAGFPIPTNLKGATGSIVIQMDDPAKMTVSVAVLESSISFKESADDLWDIKLVCEVTALPALSGFTGSQVTTSTDPSYEAVQTHEGIAKGVDPDGLNDLDTFRYDLDGLTDTSAAETTAITDLIGAYVATRAAMKLRRADFQRTDPWGGTVVVTCSRTTTAEDVINEATHTTVDPANLVSEATAAAINGNPTTPTADVFQIRSTTTSELNDQKTLTRRTYGLNTTQQDREFDASGILDDPTDLEDGTEIALVQGSSTPSAPSTPSGLKIISTATKELTPAKWLHTFRYGRRDNKDTIEQEGTFNDIDVSDLTSEGRQTTVYTTAGGVPADPSPPSGLQIVSSRVTVRNNVKSIKVWMFAKDTTKQKAEQDASFEDVDPQGIESKTAVAEVDATPSTPAGLVLRSTRTKSLTNDHDLNIVEAGEKSTADDETFGRTRQVTDASTLEQEDSLAVVFTTGTTPSPPTRSGMVVTGFYDLPLTNASASNLSVRVYQLSYVTNTQRKTLPHYELATDPNDLETTQRQAVIWDSSGAAPSDPSLPSGLKLVTKTDISVNTHPTLRIRVYKYAKRDTADDIVMPRTTFEATSFLAQRAANASIITSTSAPSTIGNTNFLALKDQITFESISVVRLNANELLQVITTQVAAKIVEGSLTDSSEIITPAYWDGTDVWVYMVWKLKVGTNLWQFFLAEQYYEGQKICFTVTQRVSGSTLPYYYNLLNTKNDATFYGIAAGYVRYRGVTKSMTNVAISTDRVSSITWLFEADTLGIIKMGDAHPGEHWTTTDLTSVGPAHGGAWVKASDLGLSATVRPNADYSVFT